MSTNENGSRLVGESHMAKLFLSRYMCLYVKAYCISLYSNYSPNSVSEMILFTALFLFLLGTKNLKLNIPQTNDFECNRFLYLQLHYPFSCLPKSHDLARITRARSRNSIAKSPLMDSFLRSSYHLILQTCCVS